MTESPGTSESPGASEPRLVLARIVEVLGGDVADVLTELRDGDLSDRFASWIRDGANDRVTADEISEALGEAHLAVIADQTGRSQAESARRIALELPGLVDEATPGGDTAALDSLVSTSPSVTHLRAYSGSAGS